MAGEAIHHHRHPWAQPGDEPNRWWMLRFDDYAMGDMFWRGEDAEAEARAAYARYAPTWNCHLFAAVEAIPSATQAECEELRGRLEIILGPARAGLLRASRNDYWNGIVAEVEAAVTGVRHVRLTNHQAAHLFAWAALARDVAIDAFQADRPEPSGGEAGRG